MPKQHPVRRPKQKFSGNQFTKSSRKTAESVVSEEPCPSTDANRIPEDTEDIASVSSKKAEKLFPESADEQNGKESGKDGVKDSSITGYRLVDMEILSSVFSSLRCADCGSFSLTLTENRFKRSGCASCLRIFCENCGWRSEFHSSRKQTQSFEVNRCLVYTMRSLGKRAWRCQEILHSNEHATTLSSKAIQKE